MRLWTLLLTFEACLLAGERVPAVANFQDSAAYRWLNAPVLESRLLDDMESLANWTACCSTSTGAGWEN